MGKEVTKADLIWSAVIILIILFAALREELAGYKQGAKVEADAADEARKELADISTYNDQLNAQCERMQQRLADAERQELSVWEGPMPESNGRSNFTVILHNGDLTEGICVYRSEYPDRARYEADCFRHLIGDPAFSEKPFICDYDADKHSGYVKPSASPPAPVSVVLPDRAAFEVWRDRRNAMIAKDGGSSSWYVTQAHYATWEEAIDKVKELNQ